MSELLNLTPFAATCIPSMTRHDESVSLVVVSGRFDLPPAGARRPSDPTVAEDQGEVPLADEYEDEPEASSLRREGQSTYSRPCTDIYLRGHAWTPRGQPATRTTVGVRVGPCEKGAVVFGERVWSQHVGVAAGRPQPFTSMPLVYERCFGGPMEGATRGMATSAELNPVGRGLYPSDRDAVGQLMPNIEDPKALLHSPSQRPLPCGFGPVARYWRPRRDFAGTYDQAWMDARLPLWPKDLDERFFCAASTGLQATPHLEGGEPVQIVGMSPDGDRGFSLPRVHLQARFERNKASTRRRMVLDAVELDTDEATLTMTWRAYLVCDPLEVVSVVVRLLDDWELSR